MNPSNPFERKVITLPTLTVKGKKPKSKKRKLSSDLLEKKLKIKAKRGFHKDMKKAFPIDSLKDPKLKKNLRQQKNLLEKQRSNQWKSLHLFQGTATEK